MLLKSYFSPLIRTTGCSFALTSRRASRGCFSGGTDEREQIRIDSVFVRRTHSMRQARIDFQLCVLNNLGGLMRRGADRNNLVVIAVENERWHIELLEIFCEVCLRE